MVSTMYYCLILDNAETGICMLQEKQLRNTECILATVVWFDIKQAVA